MILGLSIGFTNSEAWIGRNMFAYVGMQAVLYWMYGLFCLLVNFAAFCSAGVVVAFGFIGLRQCLHFADHVECIRYALCVLSCGLQLQSYVVQFVQFNTSR